MADKKEKYSRLKKLASRCPLCGEKGHKKEDCPLDDIKASAPVPITGVD
jgi:hypothetical protein